MCLATLSIICKCGILEIGFYSRRARPTEVFKLVLSLGAQITRTGTYVCKHAYRQARARTPYYHGTQTKTKAAHNK